MITADQLVAHLIGDYVLQSHWMAQNKTKRDIPAFIHALTYSLVFVWFQPSIEAFLVILWSHWLIDRYRMARYVVWVKNWLGPNEPWAKCSATGFPENTPAWLAVWLLIIVDNILHIVINGLALRFL